jgi:hypothetical protein
VLTHTKLPHQRPSGDTVVTLHFAWAAPIVLFGFAMWLGADPRYTLPALGLIVLLALVF